MLTVVCICSAPRAPREEGCKGGERFSGSHEIAVFSSMFVASSSGANDCNEGDWTGWWMALVIIMSKG